MRVDLDGLSLYVATVEDVILAKLEWAKQGGSLRQLQDVTSLVQVRGRELDLAYIHRWAMELGVLNEWESAQRTLIP